MSHKVKFIRDILKLGAKPVTHVKIFKHQFPRTDFVIEIIDGDVNWVPFQKLFKIDKLVVGFNLIVIIHIEHFFGQIASCVVGLHLGFDHFGFILVRFLVGVENQLVHVLAEVIVDLVYLIGFLFVQPVKPLHSFCFTYATLVLFFLKLSSFFN